MMILLGGKNYGKSWFEVVQTVIYARIKVTGHPKSPSARYIRHYTRCLSFSLNYLKITSKSRTKVSFLNRELHLGEVLKSNSLINKNASLQSITSFIH